MSTGYINLPVRVTLSNCTAVFGALVVLLVRQGSRFHERECGLKNVYPVAITCGLT
jgi:hypothetical protein